MNINVYLINLSVFAEVTGFFFHLLYILCATYRNFLAFMLFEQFSWCLADSARRDAGGRKIGYLI